MDHLFEKSPDNVIRVTRTSRWGNPYKLDEEMSRDQSLELYEEYLQDKLEEDPDFLKPLAGKSLACFCDLEETCHVDVLLKYVD